MGGLFGGKKAASQTTPAETTLHIQSSVAGKTIPVVAGRTRISGNLVWYGDFASHGGGGGGIGGGGGKGGMGGGTGGTPASTSYSASVIIGLCHGPIAGIGQCWAGKDSYASLASLAAGAVVRVGAVSQDPWAYLSASPAASDQFAAVWLAILTGQPYAPPLDHTAQSMGYSALSYIAIANADLGTSANLPNWNWEVIGLGTAANDQGDVLPGEVIRMVLTDSQWGCGLPESVLDSAAYDDFCTRTGLVVSVALESTEAARDIITHLLEATGATATWSQGTLRLMPYYDVPTMAAAPEPVLDIGYDDLIVASGRAPVSVTRLDPASLYTAFSAEFLDRSNGYATQTVTTQDAALVEVFGRRDATGIQAHFLTSAAVAQTALSLVMARQTGIRATYEISLGPVALALEPGDIITITEVETGLEAYPVRITAIEEAEGWSFTVTAEDCPGLMGSSALSALIPAGSAAYRRVSDYVPAQLNPPSVVEPPLSLTTGGQLELWVGASSTDLLWGGCSVWVSLDGASYKYQGRISTAARQGAVVSAIAADVAVITVDISACGGQLLAATALAAELATICQIDDEVVSYQSATLLGSGLYQLTGVQRGLLGTAAAPHRAGSAFVRLDDALLRIPFPASRIGRRVWLKLLNENHFRTAEQSLSAVIPVVATLRGIALTEAPAAVQGLVLSYVAGLAQLSWQAVSDPRPVDYEVRRGSSWSTGLLVGRTPVTACPVAGAGTYWVAAHISVPGGTDVYGAAQGLLVSGAALASNVIAVADEASTGWSGTATGLVPNSGVLVGTAGGSASYTIPAAHRVSVGRTIGCAVLITAAAQGLSNADNMLIAADVLVLTDVLGASAAAYVTVTPQLRLTQDGAIWSEWADWVPGSYVATSYDVRVLLSSSDPTVTPVLTALQVAIDVPDRLDSFSNLLVPAGGRTFTYAAPFLGGPNGQAVPSVQVTLVNASPGDDVILTAQTLSSVTLKIVNGATDVARSVNLLVQGY